MEEESRLNEDVVKDGTEEPAGHESEEVVEEAEEEEEEEEEGGDEEESSRDESSSAGKSSSSKGEEEEVAKETDKPESEAPSEGGSPLLFQGVATSLRLHVTGSIT